MLRKVWEPGEGSKTKGKVGRGGDACGGGDTRMVEVRH